MGYVAKRIEMASHGKETTHMERIWHGEAWWRTKHQRRAGKGHRIERFGYAVNSQGIVSSRYEAKRSAIDKLRAVSDDTI